MLIHETIQTLRNEGKLFRVETFRWRQPEVRQIHVAADIYRFLNTESRDKGTNRDRGTLQALFDAFIAGDLVSATLEETEMGTDLKRLSPGSIEVWELKLGKRKFKQWRLFGRFARFNDLIVLTVPVDRTNIDIQSEILRCQQEWQKMFGDRSPLHGRYIDDYFSSAPISLTNP